MELAIHWSVLSTVPSVELYIYTYIYIQWRNKDVLYLAMLGFEPTPTSTAASSNTETTVIPSRPLRSLKKELSWPRFMLDFSALPVG